MTVREHKDFELIDDSDDEEEKVMDREINDEKVVINNEDLNKTRYGRIGKKQEKYGYRLNKN